MRQNETIWNNMRQYETIWDNMRKYDPAPIRGSCRQPGVRFATSNARTEETSDARTERKSYFRQQCNTSQQPNTHREESYSMRVPYRGTHI